ncbi:MAG: hypothetical protein WHS89_01240 [Acidimicrobiales bacterium]
MGARAAVATGLANSAVQIGDPELAGGALAALATSTGFEPGIGVTERVVADGMTSLQLGDVEGALARLVPVAGDGDDEVTSPYAQSALVLALAAAGRRREAEQWHARIEARPEATYLDRAMSRLGVELVRARDGDEGTAERLGALIADLDGTDDRVAPAVARLVEAMVLEALRLPTSELARQLAEQRLEDLGISAEGWRTIGRLALQADPAPLRDPVV